MSSRSSVKSAAPSRYAGRGAGENDEARAGFVSASIHKSLDGVRVANYAQWRKREDFEAMMKSPEAKKHMEPIAKIAKFDAHLYEVSETMSI